MNNWQHIFKQVGKSPLADDFGIEDNLPTRASHNPVLFIPHDTGLVQAGFYVPASKQFVSRRHKSLKEGYNYKDIYLWKYINE